MHASTGFLTKQKVFLPGGVLQWMKENTPAHQWWGFGKRSPLGLAMANAGIKYNTAYAAMQRALEREIVDYDPDTKLWRWVAPEKDHGFDANPLLEEIRLSIMRLSQTDRLALHEKVQNAFPTNSLHRCGAYELRILDFTDKAYDLDRGPLALTAVLFYRGNKIADFILPLEVRMTDQELAKAKGQSLSDFRFEVEQARQMANRQPSAAEIEKAATIQHRAEMAELAATDFDYDVEDDDSTGESE